MGPRRLKAVLPAISGTGLALFVLTFMTVPAQAFHDQGYACYVCHSLKPSDIRPGSNAILRNPPQNILGSIPTNPRTDRPMPGTGGYPISCDFCHSSLADVPAAKFALKTYRHPVDLIQTGDNTGNPREITCNDCHNGNNGGTGFPDLTPSTLIAKTATDGYPDHDNVNNVYAHDLTNNPPHLTQPYWSVSPASLPGVNRTNDTTFWTNVRGDTQDMVCWVCHASGRQSPFTQVTSARLVKQDYIGTGRAKGHQIRTNAGGSQLGVGAALPCYDCHDSHGSNSAALLLDNQSIYGAATSQLAVTGFTGANDLVVCSQCHDTGNTATSTTKVAGVGRIVEGLHPVDPYNSATYSTVHTDVGIADNMLLSARNCLANNAGCHASPHNPSGESSGGENCGTCHGTIFAAMRTGSNTGYHHVLMIDNAPVPGAYPTNSQPVGQSTDRTCTICHVDHDLFSPQVVGSYQRSRNLRRDIALQPDNTTNVPVAADFDNALANGGICTSCHANTQTKRNPGTDIRDDGSTTTPVVSKTFFLNAAHNYGSSSPFLQGRFKSDNTLFNANCTKCHNDTTTKKFQDNTAPYSPFSLHSSNDPFAVDKLLAPLGYSPVTDNLSERFCYRCHSRTSDTTSAELPSLKGSPGRDWYNNVPMDNSAESVFGVFHRTSRHPVAAAEQTAGAKVVDCLNCHNVHLTRSTTGGVVSDPDNTYALSPYNIDDNSTPASIQNRALFCLKCHDGGGPTYQVSGTAYVPANVYITNPSMNKWAWGRVPDNASSSRGHWNVSGQLQGTTIKACDACHDKHGSTARKLLGVFDNNSGVNRINGVPVSATVTAADNAAVCYSCHAPAGAGYAGTVPVATYETYRDATGYFSPVPPDVTKTTVRWPGKAAFDCTALVFGSKQSPHGNTSATGPSSLGSRAVADCNGCHDPHGTAYTYNMLQDNLTATTFKLCFDCHGLPGSPSSDNIAQYFPTANGGLSGASTSTTNVGHNIKNKPAGGLLNVGNGLPCYDCHMTHGSARGNSQMKSDQRWTSLGNTKYGSTPSDNVADNNSRTFCLGCHVAFDDAATTGTVEGLDRQLPAQNKLKLPSTNAIEEHRSTNGQGCQRCHYGRNYNDNTYGPHYPGTGLCDTCHESQGARAATTSWNGAHRTHTDNGIYGFACKQCHTWTGTSSRATHKNDDNVTAQHAEVVFDNQATSGRLTIQYATAFQYGYRSIYNNPYTGGGASPTYVRAGVDNATADLRQGTVRWTNGTCGAVWCHSNANPVVHVGGIGVSNVFAAPSWVDNSLGATCTGCHGGDKDSGTIIGDNTTARNGSAAHLKHVNGGIGCYKCHYNTVATANNRQVDNVSSHVNAGKDVVFEPATVGGTWNNSAKTCSATYCHGTPATLPDWDNLATVTGCGVCHQNQGAATSGASFSGAHHGHTTYGKMRVACEACHADHAGSHANTVHAGGPDNAAAGKTAEVRYTDNAADQAYDNVAAVYLSKDLWNNPFTGLPVAPGPGYANAPTPTGNDAINANISWTRGACSNVWCHSNANPLGGANAYRTPQWTATCLDCHKPGPVDVDCTQCHAVKAAAAQMGAADNLSRVHVRHAATDLYNFTCDECHAWTVPNDSHGLTGLGIIAGTGHDNHINGVKTVRFSATLRTTNINQGGGTYDNAVGNYSCYNIYCHSAGLDNVPTNGSGTGFAQPGGWPRDNTVGWDNTPTTVCTSCHKGSSTSGFPMDSLAHDNHVNNTTVRVDYACNRCHNQTVGSDNATILSYSLHVNGVKNVSFLDNATTASYVNASKTCSSTFCHRQGNRSLTGAQDNLSIAWDCTVNTDCKTCHGSRTGAGYTASGASLYGEPNYDNAAFGGGLLTANSHYKHMRLPGATGTTFCYKCHANTADNTTNGKLMGTGASHLNDNVDVTAGVGVLFAWNQGSHQCSNISCHGGTGANAVWGQSLNCAGCHVSFGIENWTYNTGTHRMHTDNTQYKVACETCHAWKSTLGNVGHGNGDNNAGGPQYVEIRFTDNGSNQAYSTNPTAFFSDNMFGSWYARTWSPSYTASSTQGGFDNLANGITWSTGTCNNVYCHSNAAPLGSPAGAVVRTAPAWGSAYGCNVCHSFRDTFANMVADNNNLSKVHAQHVASNLYNIPCFECHGSTVNAADNIAAYDNHVSGTRNWRFSATFKGSINQGAGTYSGSPNYQCANLYCHSTGVDNAAFGAPVVTPRWDNAGNTGCTFCHGGNRSSASPIATGSHATHVSTKGFVCSKCHYGTITSGTQDNVIAVYDNHVNGYRNVQFSPDIGGSYSPADKSCRNTYCHGTIWSSIDEPFWSASQPIPRWGDPSSVPNCGVCHVDQGAGAPYDWRKMELHHPHSAAAYPNLEPNYVRIACETCHAQKSLNPGLHPNVNHGGGDDNVLSARTAEVRFTDNGVNQTYGGMTFLSRNTWTNPYTGAGVTPTYAEGAYASGDNDVHNTYLSWTQGTCGTSWCHSNANPLGWKGAAGTNAYRTPKWSDTQVGPQGGACYYCHVDPMREAYGGDPRNMVLCARCHRGPDTAAAMAGTDNLSGGHITHVATDRYVFTCDECHAWTAVNDNNTKLVPGTGHDNHVDGVKTVRFSTTLRTTNIDQGGGTYSGSPNYQCANVYCHSNGTDNATFGSPLVTPRWDNVGNTTCTYCHGWTAQSGTPILTGAHDNHVSNAAVLGTNFSCYRCHDATVGVDNVTIDNYALHVNGYKNVTFSDNASTASYSSPTCSNTFCHRQGNRSLGGAQDNLSILWTTAVNTDCKTCHGSKTVQAGYSVLSNIGEPNYDNGAFGGGDLTRNSHARHVGATDNTTVCGKCHPDANPTTVNALATDNYAKHLNDNVEVQGGNGAAFSWDGPNHTCANISCHGGAGTAAKWGDSLGCRNCHGGTGDLDDFGVNGVPSSMGNNGRVARIDNTEWTTRGHGATAAYAVTGRPGAAFTGSNECLYCHASAVTHNTAANIFRLANFDVPSGSGWNGVCMVCHQKTGNPGGYGGRNATVAFVDNNHWGSKHSSPDNNGGRFCYDCHDPHGDNNISMVAKQVARRTDGTYGIPFRTSIDDNQYRPGVAFSGNGTGLNYASTDNAVPFNGICEVCHTFASHYRNTGRTDSTHPTTKCVVCHTHDSGFKGLGGPDVGQYFDRKIQAPGPNNYPDNSSHPLRGLTDNTSALLYGGENCLGCHYSSGAARTGDECLKCHFEDQPNAPGNHMNGVLELAAISSDSLPTTRYTISSIQNYDSWCLQCHGATTITLGGQAPSATAKTLLDPAAFTNGRHRTNAVGCIYCHQPHGRSNAKIVRENPSSRRTAGATPLKFNVFPSDNLGLGDNVAFRARPYWADNALPYLAEADDDQQFCNRTCHNGTFSQRKDRMIKRDGTTGFYTTTGAPLYRKIYIINGNEYTVDNMISNTHVHVNNEIINTDNLVKDYALLIGLSGPSYYQYPLTASSRPSAYNPATSDLLFSPDFVDSVRDFPNAYGIVPIERIAYRFTCSTCHNPHGTTLGNTLGGDPGYPDLRLQKTVPNTLCNRCHK